MGKFTVHGDFPWLVMLNYQRVTIKDMSIMAMQTMRKSMKTMEKIDEQLQIRYFSSENSMQQPGKVHQTEKNKMHFKQLALNSRTYPLVI